MINTLVWDKLSVGWCKMVCGVSARTMRATINKKYYKRRRRETQDRQVMGLLGYRRRQC